MTSFLPLLAVVSLCFAGCRATTSCENKVAVAYLDAAVDMISKAKTNISSRSDCETNITRGALDCSELFQKGHRKNGVYMIWPASRLTDGQPMEVYCDMQTDGGGWTVIQRRGNFQREADYFFKTWKSYKEGFGDIEKDFWLGNDNIFSLTNQKLYSARFDLKDVENQYRYAQYDTFWIDDEFNKYTLHINGYTGDAGDSMVEHKDQKFSTKDEKNDNQKDEHCAQLYKGGWWYNKCHAANLNGLYLRGKHPSFANGVNWKTWKGYHDSLESTEIKVRPKNFRPHQLPATTQADRSQDSGATKSS